MAHAVKRSVDDTSELLGLPRERSSGERLHLEVAKLLLEKRLLSLTGLAVAMRQAPEWGSGLAQTIISSGQVRPIDYYRAVAEVYGVRFVDLKAEPIDEALVDVKDRADYAERHLVPWRKIDGRLLIATTEISAEHFNWGDARFGADNYDFVITSPFDILWETQKLFRDWDSFLAREALFSWKPEHSAKFTVTRPQTVTLWAMLGLLAVALVLAPMPTLVTLMSVFTTIYTLTFVFKFVLTFVGASRKADMEISPEAVAALGDADLPVYSVLVPMYKEAEVLPLLTRALKGLDYPASKLEVKLVLEEDDLETIDAAKALKLPGTFEILRVEAGIARFGVDMDETNVVPETNLDDAVSFTKGCYVGQEIIVRIKHRGHPAKKLTGLRFETDQQIEPGAIIRSQENQEIGRVTSAVISPRSGSIGLGYVRYEYLADGTHVVVGDGIDAIVGMNG